MSILNSDYVALLSLIVSIVALVVSLMPVLRDHPKVKTYRSIVESEKMLGQYDISVSVSNSGRRPITISFVLARQPGEPGHSFSFGTDGGVYLENNGSASTVIRGEQCGWRTASEASNFEIYVIDSNSRRYRVPS